MVVLFPNTSDAFALLLVLIKSISIISNQERILIKMKVIDCRRFDTLAGETLMTAV